MAARCPAHEDRSPSLSVGEGADGRVLLRCFAGCSTEEIVAALGLELRDLFADTRTTPRGSRATVQRSAEGVAPLQPDQEGLRARAFGCTLEVYAEAKGLPLQFLRSLHLEDAKYAGVQAVRVPYVTVDGEEQAVRFRVAIDGEDKFRWKKRSKLCLYGLPQLRSARERGFAILRIEQPRLTDTHETAWLTRSAAYSRVLAGVDWCLKARRR